jgi:hypothetical protein
VENKNEPRVFVKKDKSPSELLSDVTKKTVMAIKFKPAKAGGRYVPVCIELTIRFKLSG